MMYSKEETIINRQNCIFGKTALAKFEEVLYT